MAQNLNHPWLRAAIADLAAELNAKVKSPGRLQIFRFAAPSASAQPTDERAFPVSCEVSDGEDFMLASFSAKSLKTFLTTHGRALSTATGAVLQITSCSLRLHSPHAPAVPSSHCPNIDGSKCPRAICYLQRPQLWLLISAFSYLGGDGNSVFGEPHNVHYRPAVGFVLEKHLSLSTASPSADSLPPKRVAADLDQPRKSPDPSLQTRKKKQKQQRQMGCAAAGASRARAWPTLEDVPFIEDMKSVWECHSLWSALAIQQVAVPFMPIHGLLASRSPSAHSKDAHPPTARPSPSSLGPEPADTLGGLLCRTNMHAVPASAVMTEMYGPVCTASQSTVKRWPSDEAMAGADDEGDVDEDEEEGLFPDTAALLSQAPFWDTPQPFFTSTQFDG
ncbi:hypothetical protein GGI04_002149 [Coemansia thaxteri]|uniref:Uncharacterized protein n=1 Tax=Coemansia thaxteri TaxID=2663907 RepID=A0A9W8BNF7_9FUNG|nr:hypothetical protein GGI04_002149 [Coemansia thaxteri]KAJ2007726.1 hypothetical protein H4R26_000607 [Coemansia thaxteri]KAJ2471976.1 hypothetical protein GGI02_001907 [Coemansia sp. RSA 2322]